MYADRFKIPKKTIYENTLSVFKSAIENYDNSRITARECIKAMYEAIEDYPSLCGLYCPKEFDSDDMITLFRKMATLITKHIKH